MNLDTIVGGPEPHVVRVRTARAGFVSLLCLSLGHLFVDLYSGALSALQPLLVERFGMTLAQAGMLGGLLMFSSSLCQPLYGYLSDRLHTRMFAAAGPGVAAIFISALGLAPGYWALVALVLLGGAGVAAFHPQATAGAGAEIPEKRARSMAFFISAGTLGFALGPTYFSVFASRLGLHGTMWAAIPGVVASLLLMRYLPASAAPQRTRSDWSRFRAVWKPLAILYALVFIRSIVQVTFAQLAPLYLHRERGFSVEWASYTLSLYLGFGALGGFIGGHLADRFGGKRIILISMIGSVPPLLLFFLGHGLWAIAGLLVGGLVLLFTIPVNVVMAQELVPSQAGTVSALMMGFAWGSAGLIFIPLAGWFSDMFSMHTTLMALTAFPILGFFLTMRLPE